MSNLIDSWLEAMYEDQHGYPLDVMDDPSDPMSRECDQCGAQPYEECRWFCLSHEDALGDAEDWDGESLEPAHSEWVVYQRCATCQEPLYMERERPYPQTADMWLNYSPHECYRYEY